MSETPISAKALYNSVTPTETSISAKVLYNAVTLAETSISAKALYNAMTLTETPITAKALYNEYYKSTPPPTETPEYVIGLTYNAWVFKSTEKQWYKDGIANPPDIPANDIGVQWGLRVWSVRRKEWLLG